MYTIEVYSIVVCIIILIALISLLGIIIYTLVKFYFKCVSNGLEDEELLEEYNNKLAHQKRIKFKNYLYTIIDIILLVILAFSVITKLVETSSPKVLVVKSESMSYKYEGNKYLYENNLNTQFDKYDIVFIKNKPQESDLKLYDIVVYKASNGDLIIHRIVEIKKVDKSYIFYTQGDACTTRDTSYVSYNQIVGLYTGTNIKFIGSFVMFLQSVIGILCIFILIIGFMVLNHIENKIEEHKQKRIEYLNNKKKEQEEQLLKKEQDELKNLPNVFTTSYSNDKKYHEIEVIYENEIEIVEKNSDSNQNKNDSEPLYKVTKE